MAPGCGLTSSFLLWIYIWIVDDTCPRNLGFSSLVVPVHFPIVQVGNLPFYSGCLESPGYHLMVRYCGKWVLPLEFA